MKKASKDTPLAEITLRRYEKPYELRGRELVKKLCLSIGLLQPGDSRDVIADVLHVLLKEAKNHKELTSDEIRDLVIKNREEHKLNLSGVASSNIRRQLKRLRGMFVAEKVKNKYRITEFAQIADTFEEKVQRFLLPSVLSRVSDYLKAADKEFQESS